VARSIRIPSYRLHKPTNQAIVVIRGRTFYLGRYGSVESRDEYERIIAQCLAKSPTQPAQAILATESDLSIAELILAFWRHVEAYYVKDGKPTSHVHVMRMALRPVRKLYGHTRAKEFGPLALKTCRDEMVAHGLTRKSINSQVSRIRQMFRWAAEQELLPASIHQSLSTVAGLKKGRTAARENPPISPVSDSVVDKTLAHLPITVVAMVHMQRLTGMRPGEVIQMRTGDLNTSGGVWEYRPGSHKAQHHDRDRVIFLGPQSQEVLKPWLQTDLQAYLFSPKQSEAQRSAERRAERKSKLWPSHVTHQAQKRSQRQRRSLGDHYSAATYRRSIARACDLAFPHPELSLIPAAELTDSQREALKAWRKAHRWHPHRVRHGVATAIRRRFGLEGAQIIMGHNELGTTQIYAEKNLDAARAIMQEVG
jgi:integrase